MSKAVLITGASRGIGRASALLAAKHGWAVGVNYRNDVDAAEEVVRTIAKAGGRAVPLKGDVAIEADILAIFEQATQALGLLTGVVVNARHHRADRAAGRDERRSHAAHFRGQRARRLSHGARGGAAYVDLVRRRGRLDRAHVLGRRAPRLAQPLCRLCRLERRDRYADPGARQGARARERARQRHSAGPGRYQRFTRAAGSPIAPERLDARARSGGRARPAKLRKRSSGS